MLKSVKVLKVFPLYIAAYHLLSTAKSASPETEQKLVVIYLKYGDYRPEKVVKVFPMTASFRAHSL